MNHKDNSFAGFKHICNSFLRKERGSTDGTVPNWNANSTPEPNPTKDLLLAPRCWKRSGTYVDPGFTFSDTQTQTMNYFQSFNIDVLSPSSVQLTPRQVYQGNYSGTVLATNGDVVNVLPVTRKDVNIGCIGKQFQPDLFIIPEENNPFGASLVLAVDRGVVQGQFDYRFAAGQSVDYFNMVVESGQLRFRTSWVPQFAEDWIVPYTAFVPWDGIVDSMKGEIWLGFAVSV